MLNEMRLGAMSPNTIQRFNSLTRELKSDDGLRPTELFPLRNQVDEANTRMLARLTGPSKVYTARDRGPQADKMDNMCPAPSTLNLKINSQVMLLRNQGGGSGGLVNGSIGVLIGFSNRPADNDGSLSGGAKSTPLNSPGEELPLVRFTMEEGKTRDVVIGREEWSVEMPNGTLLGARIQIPLGLAWSLSIHKSQGQTLSKVRVDLGKVFEKGTKLVRDDSIATSTRDLIYSHFISANIGQAYVALSRATSLEGLQVLNFDPRRVMVHPKVIDFYRNLQVYKK
ncbi:MAG: P-loop containing nucleoside triphosphate hydrolase protein [Podila humilis]|nr:MAG: P-loop containing nucleoside triphosphate hydrolase protein [Podila humilis]